MKPTFKQIATTIIVVLLAIFGFQLYSLIGIYRTIESQTYRSVMECMESANFDELKHRVDSLTNIPPSEKEREYTLSKSYDTGKKGVTLVDKLEITEPEEMGAMEYHQDNSLEAVNQMGEMVKESLHQIVDTITPINLAVYYSSLQSNFDTRGIQSNIYRIETWELNNDNRLGHYTLSEPKRGAKEYQLVYNSAQNQAYRILTDSQTKTILSQMVGTLVSTFAIFLFLALSFWYLIKTIIKLKTVEQMKEDFINNMTHELKTPIAIAYSATDTMLNFGQGEDPERRNSYLALCKEQLGKLSNLVEQILSMSRDHNVEYDLKKEQIEIAEMIESLTYYHQLKRDKEVEFNLSVEPANLTIYADRTHIGNVVSNLIDNAIKYSTESPVIDIKIFREETFNIISVRDNGIGIESDKLEFIFDKFYRLPQGNQHNSKGYGIGLYYAKSTVLRHGGTIDVSSTPNGGSTFTIKIPVK